MIDYTACLTRLMCDIVSRVPDMAAIDMNAVLVFARFGRSRASGTLATCHPVDLPPSEPVHDAWRHRRTRRLERRSEWFVWRSPEVSLGGRRIRHLISFSLPRFCDQTPRDAHTRRHYGEAPSWLARLDTVVHELYHIDTERGGIRRGIRSDGRASHRTHGPRFYARVAFLVQAYLASRPDREMYEFLAYDLRGLTSRYGGVVAMTFRMFPAFPQRYVERLDRQPDGPPVDIVSVRPGRRRTRFTERDLERRRFTGRGARRWTGRLTWPARSAVLTRTAWPAPAAYQRIRRTPTRRADQ